jgi:hypothetical protein
LETIAECLRTYGGIVCDNSGIPANLRGAIQLEHDLSGDWAGIGVTQAALLTAMHSLLEPAQAKARVLDIPTFVGGDKNNVACYPGVAYPPGHPCNP